MSNIEGSQAGLPMTARTGVSGHALNFVLLTIFLDMVGYGIIIPILPSLIEQVGHLDTAGAAQIAGWMFLAFSLTRFVFSPIVGNLSDRYGRRPLLLLAILGLGIDHVLSAVAPTLGWLIFARVIGGACGSSWVVANAYIADVTAPEHRARAYGMLGAAFGAGLVIGPALGGLLGEFGPRVPFWAAAVISFLNLGYGLLVLPETLAVHKRRKFDWKRANPFGAFAIFRRYPGVLPMCGVLCLYTVASVVYPAIWPFWGKIRFGWSESTVGITLAIFGLLMAACQGLLVGPAARRLGERRAVIVGLLCAIIACIGYGFTGSLIAIVGLMLIHAPEGFIHPMLMSMMTRAVPEDAQGELQGGISAMTNLAMLVGTLGFTQAFSWFMSPAAPFQTPNASFWIAGLLLLVTLVIFVMLVPRPRRG